MTDRMKQFMSEYYTEMKNDMGFGNNMGEHEDLPPLEEVVQQLRPNLNPSNFSSFMQKKDNYKKDFRNKQIARKLQTKIANEEFNNTNLAKQF